MTEMFLGMRKTYEREWAFWYLTGFCQACSFQYPDYDVMVQGLIQGTWIPLHLTGLLGDNSLIKVVRNDWKNFKVGQRVQPVICTCKAFCVLYFAMFWSL